MKKRPEKSAAGESAAAERDGLVRFGVSMPARLIGQLDAWLRGRGYPSRSEAVRDMVRDALVESQWQDGDDDSELVGVVTIVYRHTIRELSENLIETQHHHHDIPVATLHIHLSHENCLEVIVLRGPRSQVVEMANQLISARGVLHGKFVPTTTGTEI